MNPTLAQLQDRAVGEACNGLAAGRNVLLNVPTGGGKTPVYCRTIEWAHETGLASRSMVLQHRSHLVDNAERGIARWATNSSLAVSTGRAGELDQTGDVVASMIQTAHSNLEKLQPVDLLVIDEAHHASGDDKAQYTAVINRLLELNPNMRLVAASATLDRPDNKGLHRALADADFVSIGLKELVRAGQIALPVTHEVPILLKNGRSARDIARDHLGPDMAGDHAGLNKKLRELRPADYFEQMASQWERLAPDKRTIAFTSNIADAEAFAAVMRERIGADKVAVVHSKTESAAKGIGELTDAELTRNAKALAAFERGQVQMLVNVKMLDEGLHVDGAACLVNLRETVSQIEQAQMNGRVMGNGRNGESRVVLDGGASTAIHGAVEKRADVLDYLQQLARGELAYHRVNAKGEYLPHRGTFSPWKLLNNPPPILAMTDGQTTTFARIGTRVKPGGCKDVHFTLVEARKVKGREQVTFLRDAAGLPLRQISSTELERIEAERVLPARLSVMRLASTQSKNGRPIETEILDRAKAEHMTSVIAFTEIARARAKSQSARA